MKQLSLTFDAVPDPTGYLFSFAKSLSAALFCSRYRSYAADIIASSGFAFRMWVDGQTLCPSAMSIWDFQMQKPWVENGGLRCGYVQRLWNEGAVEERRRMEALEQIRAAVEDGVAPVVWDLGDAEWGVVTGYDDTAQTLFVRRTDNCPDTLSYEKLGKLEIPILSVLTVTGDAPKSDAQLVADTKRLAADHLWGNEWCGNAKGLAAYDALIAFVETSLTVDIFRNLEYYLGTYGALKWYAWQFFEKYGQTELCALYRTVYDAWKSAFDLKRAAADADALFKTRLTALLRTAQRAEIRAAEHMKETGKTI